MVAVLAFALEFLQKVNLVRVELVVAVRIDQPIKPRAFRPVAVDVKTVVRVAHAHRLPDLGGDGFDLRDLALRASA